MSNDYLMSNDYMTGGVYRAFIIKKDEARVYIPGLLNKNILDSEFLKNTSHNLLKHKQLNDFY